MKTMNDLPISTDLDALGGVYRFAGIPVRICSQLPDVHLMCADYRTDLLPELTITSSQEEIAEERRRNGDADERLFDDGYIETLVVYRKMALALLDRGVLLMHGSAIALDGKGLLFTAVSGTGKSTHTRLWHQVFGDRVTMINDDKPLIKVASDMSSPIIYGTPWDGKHRLSNNIAVPLQGIVFLERGEENEIHEVSAEEMFPVLMQQTFRENDMATTTKVMALLAGLTQSVKFYNLHCNMEADAAIVASKILH